MEEEVRDVAVARHGSQAILDLGMHGFIVSKDALIIEECLQFNRVKHGSVFVHVPELVSWRMHVELKSWVPIGHEEVVVHSRAE